MRIGKNKRPYHFENVERDESGKPLGISTLKHRKATRWGNDQAWKINVYLNSSLFAFWFRKCNRKP